MKTARCADLGMDCDFVAKGSTIEEVKQKLADHTETVHGELLDQMSIQEMQEMDRRMESIIA